jgi:hypothetical protein
MTLSDRLNDLISRCEVDPSQFSKLAEDERFAVAASLGRQDFLDEVGVPSGDAALRRLMADWIKAVVEFRTLRPALKAVTPTVPNPAHLVTTMSANPPTPDPAEPAPPRPVDPPIAIPGDPKPTPSPIPPKDPATPIEVPPLKDDAGR